MARHMWKKIKEAWDDFIRGLPPYLKSKKRLLAEDMRHQKILDRFDRKPEEPPDMDGGWGW